MTKKDYTEFNVGDKVRRVKGRNHGSSIGHEAVISSIERLTGKDLFGDGLLWATFEDGTSGYLKSFEYVDPEVKEPKFKVGDRVTWGKKEASFVVESFSTNEVFFVPESGLSIKTGRKCYSYHKSTKIDETFLASVEVLEPTKPEITVGSRWTFNPDSFCLSERGWEVVVVGRGMNGYVILERVDNQELIKFQGVDDLFLSKYKPYVQPPKSLVGYVGVIDDGDYQRFTLVCESEEDVRYSYSHTNHNIVAIKKIEWTEGE